jgi:hypothetical protein
MPVSENSRHEVVDSIIADKIELGFSISEEGVLIITINENFTFSIEGEAVDYLINGLRQMKEESARSYSVVRKLMEVSDD